jgi:uncharacterized protein YndB with AHSA1/START domain
MTTREQYAPGPATGARVEKTGDKWTLVLVRELHHPPEKVWRALTDPDELRQWAPYDSDKNLGRAGTQVTLTTVGAPSPHVVQTTVKRADAPNELEFEWGGGDLRWELRPHGSGTRLTLWAKIDRRYVAMGAAGWHICLDVLGHLLDGDAIGRMAGVAVLQFEGWQRLNAEYGKQFGAV